MSERSSRRSRRDEEDGTTIEDIVSLLDEQNDILDMLDIKLGKLVDLQRDTNDSLRSITRTQDGYEMIAHILREIKAKQEPIIKNAGSVR